MIQIIVEVANDHDAGVLRGWPDRYSSWVVEGARTLLAERSHCQSLLLED